MSSEKRNNNTYIIVMNYFVSLLYHCEKLRTSHPYFVKRDMQKRRERERERERERDTKNSKRTHSETTLIISKSGLLHQPQ
jgi:hypothetical protein